MSANSDAVFHTKAVRPIDRLFEATSSRHAAAMFGLSLLFLVLVALAIQWLQRPDLQPRQVRWMFWILSVLWILLLLESLLGIWKSRVAWRQALQRGLFICLVPPFRMALSTFAPYESIWLPFLGWRRIDRQLFERLEKSFAMPMLVIGLLILPIIAAEFLLKERVAEIPYLALGLDIGKGVIWLAFALEFVLMVSITERKLVYCKKNWIDLVIILLPLMAFLRGLQLLQATRIAWINKLIRVYRLRGMAHRAYRGLIVLEVLERVFHRDLRKRLAHLQSQVEDRQQEIARLRLKIQQVEEEIELRSEQSQ